MVVCDNIFYHMTIDLKTVKHISKLARISLDEKKAEKLATDMNSIFEFIEKLNELNTDNVEPLTSIAETTLRFRDDKITSENIREKILKNSPEKNDDFFVMNLARTAKKWRKSPKMAKNGLLLGNLFNFSS